MGSGCSLPPPSQIPSSPSASFWAWAPPEDFLLVIRNQNIQQLTPEDVCVAGLVVLSDVVPGAPASLCKVATNSYKQKNRELVSRAKKKTKAAAKHGALKGAFPFSVGDICLHAISSLNPCRKSLNFSSEYSTLGAYRATSSGWISNNGGRRW